MKSLFKPSGMGALLILILAVSGCDSNGNTEIPVGSDKQVTQTQSELVRLQTHTLALLNNIGDENASVEVKGYADLTKASLTFQRIGLGATDEQAKKRLDSIRFGRDTLNALTRLYSFDALEPQGARVNSVINMPRYAPLRIQQMAGKFGVYDVDAPIDIRTWRGWVTVRSATNNGKVKVDFGDVDYFQTSCKDENNVDISLDEGAIRMVPARTTVDGDNKTGRFELSVETGTIKIQGLDIESGQIVKRGNGEVFQGYIKKAGGLVKIAMKKGNLVVMSWEEFTKQGGK